MLTVPPLQSSGAVKLVRSVAEALQPPVKPKPVIQVANCLSMEVCDWQLPILIGAGQLTDNIGAGATVKVLVQVDRSGAQLEVYVQVTSTEPPHLCGAFNGASLVSDPLHPPLAVVDAMKAV